MISYGLYHSKSPSNVGFHHENSSFLLKTNSSLKINAWNMYFLLKRSLFRGPLVNFRGVISREWTIPASHSIKAWPHGVAVRLFVTWMLWFGTGELVGAVGVVGGG